MGNMVESCTCKIDCCDKFEQDKTENNVKKINDDDDE